jgi:hypothetical protein
MLMTHRLCDDAAAGPRRDKRAAVTHHHFYGEHLLIMFSSPGWQRVPKFITPGVSLTAKKRNVVLDRMFYDVEALTDREFHYLVAGGNPEGEIIVVYPKGAQGDISLQRYEDFEEFSRSPGKKITKFSIAGVGSSEVGAAALARSLADFTGEPVGAIVAGYGLPDLVSESLGGWFYFGTANRVIDTFQRAAVSDDERKARLEQILSTTKTAHPKSPPSASLPSNLADNWSGFGPDTLILVRLLGDSNRHIDTILGHSRGCLSISSALEALHLLNRSPDIARAQRARIVTTGAVVEFPPGFYNVKQYLGTLDWFGGMNSAPGKDFVPIPNAWHHVNTSIPFHMNIKEVLKQAL